MTEDHLTMQLLDQEIAAAEDRKFFPSTNFGEPQIVRERDPLVSCYVDPAGASNPFQLDFLAQAEKSGVLSEIYCGYCVVGNSLFIFPINDPKNATEIVLPGNFSAISCSLAPGAGRSEVYVAMKSCEILRFYRSPQNAVEFVDRVRVASEISCAVGNFFGSVDGRIFRLEIPEEISDRLTKRPRLEYQNQGLRLRQIWRPFVTRIPVLRQFLTEPITRIEVTPDRKFLWIIHGERNIWLLAISSRKYVGGADFYVPVKKIFPITTPFRGMANSGGAVVVCEDGSRKFVTTDWRTHVTVIGGRSPEVKATERQLRVLDASLANDTTIVMLSSFIDKRRGPDGVRTLGLVSIMPEITRARKNTEEAGAISTVPQKFTDEQTYEFREVWDWQADLFGTDEMAGSPDCDSRAWLLTTEGALARTNVTPDFKHPEALTHAVVAMDKSGVWRAKLSVRTLTRTIRKFLQERNLHSLRQTAKRVGSEVVASELMELIGNFTDVFSLAPKNGDKEVAMAAVKILFQPELAKALELVDPLDSLVPNLSEIATISGFGYVDPQHPHFTLQAMSPRLWGFARLVADALTRVWTAKPILGRAKNTGNFYSLVSISDLQRSLGSLEALGSFGQSELTKFTLGVCPGEEELLRKLLDVLSVLTQWLTVVLTLEPADFSEQPLTDRWCLRDLLLASDDVAQDLWVSGNVPEISAPRIFHERLVAQVSVDKLLSEPKVSGRQVLHCEKLVGNFLLESPKFPVFVKALADRGSVRGVLEILVRRFRAVPAVSVAEQVEQANLVISVLLDKLRLLCLQTAQPQSVPLSQVQQSAAGALAVAVAERSEISSSFGWQLPLLMDERAPENDAWSLLSETLRILMSSLPEQEAFHVALTKWLMIGNLGRPETLRRLVKLSPKFVGAYLRKKFPISMLEVVGEDESKTLEETRKFLDVAGDLSEKKQILRKSLSLFPENAALVDCQRKLEVCEAIGIAAEAVPDWNALYDKCREASAWKWAACCCLYGNFLTPTDVHINNSGGVLLRRLTELALRDCSSKEQVEKLVLQWNAEIPKVYKERLNSVVDSLARNLYRTGGTLSLFDVLMGDTEISRHVIFKTVQMEEVISDQKDRSDLALAVAEQWLEELERRKRTEKTEIVLYLGDVDDLHLKGFQVDNLRTKGRHLLASLS